MVKQLVIRINYNTLVRIRRMLPSTKGEKMVAYFNRVAKWMEEEVFRKVIFPVGA